MNGRSEGKWSNTCAGWVGTVVCAGLLMAAATTSATAQEEPAALSPGETLYEIRLTDGSVLFARVTAVEGETLVLTTSGGTRVEVDRAQIRDADVAAGTFVDGEFWREDANSSRLFFTATGRTLPRGEAYVGTYLVVLPFVAVGVTDRVTVAAGAPVLFGELEPFYLAPKVQLLRTERAQLSVGTLVFFFNDENVGITYGVGTFGTPDDALTLGLGFVFSGGFRFIGERFSTDLGVAGAAGDGELGCCVPLLSFSYAFGGGR